MQGRTLVQLQSMHLEEDRLWLPGRALPMPQVNATTCLLVGADCGGPSPGTAGAVGTGLVKGTEPSAVSWPSWLWLSPPQAGSPGAIVSRCLLVTAEPGTSAAGIALQPAMLVTFCREVLVAPGTCCLLWANQRPIHHRSSSPAVALDQATPDEVGVLAPALALV